MLNMFDKLQLLRVSSVLLLMVGLVSCSGFFTDPALSSINVTPSSPSVVVNGTQQFTAIGVNDDGSTSTLNNVTWSSSDESIASIKSTGEASAVKAGSATITATSGSISGSTTMTVTTSALDSITVTPSTATIMSGSGTQQYKAMANYHDGTQTDVTTAVQWVSSNQSVATITPNGGLATAVASGTTTITATKGNVTSQGATLTVF